MKKVILVFLVLVGSCMALELGQVPSAVTIEGENEGRTDGKVSDTEITEVLKLIEKSI